MFFVLFSVIEEPIPVNRIDKGDFEISELLMKGIYNALYIYSTSYYEIVLTKFWNVA